MAIVKYTKPDGTKVHEYTQEEKLDAIIRIQEVLATKEEKPNMIYLTADIGKELGIPQQTVYGWWVNRGKIVSIPSETVKLSQLALSLALSPILEQQMKGLDGRDYDKESLRDVTNSMYKLAMLQRLFTNQSTENKSVQVAGSVEVVVPK